MCTSVVTVHPLLEELKGLILRLECSSKPVEDNDTHLVPFCETLESIFRHGLKQPNSWFGFNKQDYWSWIQPLQNYYFDKKQNPLFCQLVQEVQNFSSIRNIEGRGRCFIRAALHHKLISVPIEHLAKNIKLTQYWYGSSSIIATPELRDVLMECLFQITSLDFNLDYVNGSFLDETWIIPVYFRCQLPPIKQLDMEIVCIDKREVIVDIDNDSLAHRAGIEKWDILEELCGTPVYAIKPNSFQVHLTKNSTDYTAVSVIKFNMSSGYSFGPSIERKLKFLKSTQSIPLERMHIVEGENKTECKLTYLGKSECKANSVSQDLIDLSVMHTLTQVTRPEKADLSINIKSVQLSTASLTLIECDYQRLGVCGQSSKHSSCLALFVRDIIDEDDHQTRFTSYVCEAVTPHIAHSICCQIAQGFPQKDI